ncbi:helix-turn-helix transcriptional regulator [Nanoarchaeota archaeon]
MKKIIPLILCILVVLLAPAVLGGAEYEVSYFVEYDWVLTDIKAEFSEGETGKYVYNLPLDAKGIIEYVDGEEVEPQLVGNRVVVTLQNNSGFRLEYLSKSEVTGDELITEVEIPFDVEKLSVKASLPSGARLLEPVGNRPVSTIFPKPDQLGTDGLNIDIRWEFEDVEKGEDVPILVKFMIPENGWAWWLVGFLLLAVLGLVFIVFGQRKDGGKEKSEKPEVVEKVVVKSDYEDHLKEDEQQIVQILKDREGRCEQGTLRVITGFSKAKLSGLLKEMDERKLVHKEKRGKKNLVFLKKR